MHKIVPAHASDSRHHTRLRAPSGYAPPPQDPLCRVLEMIPEMVAVFDLGGRLVYANALLKQAFDDSSLLAELAALAGAFTPSGNRSESAPAPEEYSTSQGQFKVRGHRVDLRDFSRSEAVLLIVRRAESMLPSDSVLRERFRLTRAEIRVARLLVEGRSNRSIAKTLFISPHTARHHTERILRKFDVTSRAAVGPKLRSLAIEDD